MRAGGNSAAAAATAAAGRQPQAANYTAQTHSPIRLPPRSCRPLFAPPAPGPSGEQRWVYTLRLQLEDGTGQLDAHLFGPDGEP